MPELPDVENLIRALRPHVVGRTIERVRVASPSTVRHPSPRALARALRGERVSALHRRGKYLLFRLASGRTLVIHLRMTGDLVVARPGARTGRWARVVFALSEGQRLVFVDQRRLGTVHLIGPGEEGLAGGLAAMGPEPLEPGFTPAAFDARLRRCRGAVKSVLLRQDVVAGLGNIYADEVLFAARLDPRRRAADLTASERRRLHRAIRRVLRRAVDTGSRYGQAAGPLYARRRPGAPCPRGDGAIQVVRVGGRSTYFCPVCQA